MYNMEKGTKMNKKEKPKEKPEKCRGCGKDLTKLNWYQAVKHTDSCLQKDTMEQFF